MADLVTYSSLRSFLYSHVDQSLQTAAQAAAHSLAPAPGFGPGGPGGPGGAGGDNDSHGPVYAPGLSVALRSDGTLQTLSPAYEAGDAPTRRSCPRATLSADDTHRGQYFFTTPSTTAGGPSFRVLVVTTNDGDQVIVGQPLDSTLATLNRLLVIK